MSIYRVMGELEQVRMSALVRPNRDTSEWIQEDARLQVSLYRECSRETAGAASDGYAEDEDKGDCVPFTFRATSWR